MGGVILTHSWTPAAFAATTAKLHATSCEIGRPLLIFVDQEGGSIRRLTWAPPARLGRSARPAGRRRRRCAKAAAAASALQPAGVDVDLAPVADTLGPGGFLGDRSFGSNSSLVGQLAATFIGALQSGGIAATAKHFPGLGAAKQSTDDHARVGAEDAARAVPACDRRGREARDGLERVLPAARLDRHAGGVLPPDRQRPAA